MTALPKILYYIVSYPQQLLQCDWCRSTGRVIMNTPNHYLVYLVPHVNCIATIMSCTVLSLVEPFVEKKIFLKNMWLQHTEMIKCIPMQMVWISTCCWFWKCIHQASSVAGSVWCVTLLSVWAAGLVHVLVLADQLMLSAACISYEFLEEASGWWTDHDHWYQWYVYTDEYSIIIWVGI